MTNADETSREKLDPSVPFHSLPSRTSQQCTALREACWSLGHDIKSRNEGEKTRPLKEYSRHVEQALEIPGRQDPSLERRSDERDKGLKMPKE